MRASLVVAALVSFSAPALAQEADPALHWQRGALRGTVSAYLQAELQLHAESETAVSADGRSLLQFDRFLLRRANVYADVRGPWFDLVLETTANTVNGPVFGLAQAYGTLRWPRDPTDDPPRAALSVGLLRAPFGWQNRVGAREWGFTEPTLAVRAMFPGQSDLGARVHGALAWLRYDVAVMNGHPIGDRSFPLLAPSGPQDIVGRVGVAVRSASRETAFEAGVSALWGRGFDAGSPATPDTIAYRDVNQTGVLDPANLVLVPGHPAVPAQSFSRWALGLDAVVRARPHRRWRFMAFAEAVVAQDLDRAVAVADPVTTGVAAREVGWAVGTVHTLFDHAVVGVRVDGYDPNADFLAPQAGRLVPASQAYVTASVLVGYALDATNRVVLPYDHIADHLAVDAAGRPTDLHNDAFTARLQVGM